MSTAYRLHDTRVWLFELSFPHGKTNIWQEKTASRLDDMQMRFRQNAYRLGETRFCSGQTSFYHEKTTDGEEQNMHSAVVVFSW